MSEEELPECDCCGFVDPVGGVEEYLPSKPGSDDTSNLCVICAKTFANRPREYPGQGEADTRWLMQTIAWIGNRLRRDVAR